MKWTKTGKTVTADGTTIEYSNGTGITIESRKRKIPHSNGKPGTWDHTSYFVLADGKTIIERHSLKDAKESAEMEIMFRQRDEKMEG